MTDANIFIASSLQSTLHVHVGMYVLHRHCTHVDIGNHIFVFVWTSKFTSNPKRTH